MSKLSEYGIVVLLGVLTAFPAILKADWNKDQKILQEFHTKTFVLNGTDMDSLLKQPLTLNDCVAVALKNNVQLQIDRMEYNRVYLAKKGTYQDFIPDLSVSATRTRTVDLDSVGRESKKTDKDDVNLNLTQKFPLGGSVQFSTKLNREVNDVDRLTDRPSNVWSIDFTQPILKGFGYRIAYSKLELADLDYQMEQIQLRSRILNTIFKVKEAYFNVIRQKKLVGANEAAIERDKTLKEVSRAKVEAKLATRRDVLSAEIILQKDYAELIRAQTEYQNALDNLKDVMGIPIRQEIRLSLQDLTFSPVSLDKEQLVEEALQNNLDIQLQKIAMSKAKFQSKLATNNVLPDISLNIGYSKTDDKDVLRDSRGHDMYGSVSLSYPIWNLDAQTARQRTILAERQVEKTLEDSRRLILIQVRSALRNMTKSVTRINILLKNIEAAKEKVVFATTMFNMGRASNLDITDAQEAMLKAEVDYVDELADYYIQLAQLEELLGGHSLIQL